MKHTTQTRQPGPSGSSQSTIPPVMGGQGRSEYDISQSASIIVIGSAIGAVFGLALKLLAWMGGG